MTQHEDITPEEQAFWDAAFCAVLTGAWANRELLIVTKRQHEDTGEMPGDNLAAMAAEQADAALQARRNRMKE